MKDNNSTPLSSGEKEEYNCTFPYCRCVRFFDCEGGGKKPEIKPSSVDTNIEEKCREFLIKELNLSPMQIGTLYDGYVKACVKFAQEHATTTPVQEKPDKQPLQPTKSLQGIKDEASQKRFGKSYRYLSEYSQLLIVEQILADQFKTPPVQESCKSCPNCLSDEVIWFTSDLDLCKRCGQTF